jgi:hypothetical protein
MAGKDRVQVSGGGGGAASSNLHADLTDVAGDQHHAESHTMVMHTQAGDLDIGAVGTSSAGGVSNKTARGDHVHAHGAIGAVANAHAHSDLSGLAVGDPHPQYATDTDLSTHAAAADPHSVYAFDTDLSSHAAAADPHTGYRLESADHTHATTGLQGGTIAHSVTTGQTATDHHPAPAAGPDANDTIDSAGAAGTAATFARSGHGHQVVTTDAPSGAAITVDAAASAAATGAIARAAHGHRLNTSAVAGVAVGTASAGTSTTAPSRGDHVHPTGAGTPSTQAFGDAAAVGTGPAASMTDHKHAMPAATVTRTLWVPGAQLAVALDTGTSTPIGTAPDIIAAVALADAATQGFHFTIATPNDWSSGAITYTIYWSPGATDAVAHTVRWSADILKLVTGTTTVLAAGTTTAFTGGSAARTVNVLYNETAQTLYTPTTVGELVRCDIRRVGADAADTYVGVVRVHGVLLSYTATR